MKMVEEIKEKIKELEKELDRGGRMRYIFSKEKYEWGTCGIYHISKKWCEVGRIDERNLHEPDKKDCYLSSRNL